MVTADVSFSIEKIVITVSWQVCTIVDITAVFKYLCIHAYKHAYSLQAPKYTGNISAIMYIYRLHQLLLVVQQMLSCTTSL